MQKFSEWLQTRDNGFYDELMNEWPGQRLLAPLLALGLSAGGDMVMPHAHADVVKSVAFEKAEDQRVVPFDVKIKDTGDDTKNAHLVLKDVQKEVNAKSQEINGRAIDWAKRNANFTITPTADKKTPLAASLLILKPDLVLYNGLRPGVQQAIKNIKLSLRKNKDGTLTGTFYLNISAHEFTRPGEFRPIHPGQITGDVDAGGGRAVKTP